MAQKASLPSEILCASQCILCCTMAKVNVCDVEVLDNPATFFDNFKFRITFECHEPLEDDLEWKVVYVGSAYNSSLDQTLDSILVGPVPVGRHQFVFEVDAPDPKKILPEDLVGVTVVLIQALYHEQEFIRIGYYVNNEYKSEELRNEPPAEPLLDELKRSIIASDPRVTRFPIDWGDGLLDGCPEPEQKEEDVDMLEVMDSKSEEKDEQEGEEEEEDVEADVEDVGEEDLGEEDDETEDEDEDEEDECEVEVEDLDEAVDENNTRSEPTDTDRTPLKSIPANPELAPRTTNPPLKQL
ncbi:Histone chaperone ASF1B [Echinococcus granulosus]|nr:Histone chaperone ASF1B [Echinococcus granulosus]